MLHVTYWPYVLVRGVKQPDKWWVLSTGRALKRVGGGKSNFCDVRTARFTMFTKRAEEDGGCKSNFFKHQNINFHTD